MASRLDNDEPAAVSVIRVVTYRESAWCRNKDNFFAFPLISR
jgi:hypothetical protein